MFDMRKKATMPQVLADIKPYLTKNSSQRRSSTIRIFR